MINIPETSSKRIVVVGGGFAGIEFIKKLKNTDYQVVLLDKNNFFTFQPLLYQVATAGLEPNSIAYPYRRMFQGAKNVYFRMANVDKIDSNSKTVHTSIGSINYDHLLLACGSKPKYFGLPEKKLLTLKTLNGAMKMKNFILHTFEEALENEENVEKDGLFNIVIAGGGPTGVELAGAFGEMKKFVLPKDYPQLDFEKLNIYLLEGKDRLLPMMSEKASVKSKKFLEQLGVKVLLGEMVLGYENNIVKMENKTVPAKNLVWTAGVQPVLIEGLEDAITHKSGKLIVDEYNQLPGFENIYAVGDLAAMTSEEYPEGHPGVAPVAIQQGKLLARNLLSQQKGKAMKPFSYLDKGTMATIGRNRAVVDAPWFKMQGTLAWFAWMFVHLITLVGFRNKVMTFIDWSYNYFTYDRALRLITMKVHRQGEEAEAKQTI